MKVAPYIYQWSNGEATQDINNLLAGIYNVIVTDNMFGDIITDLAAVTQGGMGVAAGGNVNPDGVSMFEPIGGTAPAFTGKNEIIGAR